MKKLLPKSVTNPLGFTLVELLVVISIIAILSVIGITVYAGVQKTARDARRKADINTIADAMEANYGKSPAVAGQYAPLAASMFSSNVIPVDPVATNATPESACPGVCKYCILQGGTAPTGIACATTSIAIGAGAPSGGATNTFWVICANLEAGGFYCRGNQQ